MARRWDFLLAAVSFPIIGIDFLRHHGLLVDVANLRLLPGSPPAATCAITGGPSPPRSRSYAEVVSGSPPTSASPPAPPPSPSSSSQDLPPGSDWATALRLRFPAVFAASAAVTAVPPPHGVQHYITTIGQPSTAKFRRLDPARLAAAKAEFQAMLDEGVIRRSSSQWSSPLHMVKKKDGSWRPCRDYRHLNLQTVKDKYPLPNMADLAARLAGCTIFSKLDLKKGYLQVPVAIGDIHKTATAIITPFGLFEFVRMPFGLKNAGMTFQRLMDTLLGGHPFAFIYLDDILVASSNAADHRRHLCQVFEVLEKSGLIINTDKCVFGRPSIEFLGHNISAAGSSPLPSRVAAIAEFPRPVTVRNLQAFLGLFNFYRKFIPAASRLVLPLTRALRGGPRGDQHLTWSAEMVTAFSAARLALSFSAVLEHPVDGAELSLVTDASSSHVGAAIQQKRPGQGWRPLGFFSAQLDKAQTNYSAFDRELLLWWPPSNIFILCWKGGPSPSSRTTGRSLGPSPGGQTPGWAGSNVICHLLPNFRRQSVTSPASPMW